MLDGVDAIPGARTIADKLPLAPNKDFADAILGSVGPATAELVKDSKGRIRAGDEVGISGLQKRYDEQLAGTRGATIVAVDDQGARRDPVHRRRRARRAAAARPSTSLPSVPPRRPWPASARPSALVAIRPSTGDLVAVASGPGSKGYNTATFGQLRPRLHLQGGQRARPAAGGRLALHEVVVHADDRGRRQDASRTTTTTRPRRSGRISLRGRAGQLLQHRLHLPARQAGADSLAPAAAALGLGVDHDTGFPAFFGKVARPDSETQKAAGMIGQGTVLASPMAMATVVASVLKGSAVLPRLLPEQKVEQKAPAKPLTAAEARQLRAMMRGVVERGSGRLLADVPGGPVIAKTGTAEFGDKPPLPTHAWMVAGRDDLAVAVFVERGASGSGTAGPVHQGLPRYSQVMLTRQHWARRSEQLDPVRDSHQISLHVSAHDFPWDNLQALSFALFRTYAVPSIGRLLDQTSEFTDRVQKRYDDTGLLLEEVQRHGLGSTRGRSAVRRINQMHAMYDISNEDMRYVLSTFVVVPKRWMDDFGFRPLTPERGRRRPRTTTSSSAGTWGSRTSPRTSPPSSSCSTTTSASTSPSTRAVVGSRTPRST